MTVMSNSSSPSEPSATDQAEGYPNTLAESTALDTPRSTDPATSTNGTLPERIGRYQILGLLGRGGMGSVYLAHDSQFGRRVALKVPHVRAGDEAALERFYREARSAGRLQHPHIIPVYEVGEVDGVHLMTMAYIDGQPLSALVADYARRPPRDAADLVRTLALALQEAHGQGVIHRDLKPQNIMINRRGEPMIMDFGLAREIKTDSTSHTLPGTVMGTPAYMPPEQARGDVTAIGPGSDIYSLGVILYELLTGRPPFEGNLMDVLAQHLRDAPPPPSEFRHELCGSIDAVCLKALAKEPSRRFLTMTEFAHALDGFLTGSPSVAVACALTAADPLEETAAESLLLLRTWGWEVGFEKVRAKLRARSEQTPDPRIDLLLRWMGGEAAGDTEAAEGLRGLRPFPVLAAWAQVGRAFACNRAHDFSGAEAVLRAIETHAAPGDNILRASIAHQRGFRAYHLGDLDGALAALHDALDLCGPEHYFTAQVLDTLGLVYARKNNFHAAREFFDRAIQAKQRFGDTSGIARSLRHLGALHLDWGELDSAGHFLERSLQTSMQARDERSQASDFHYLGRVALGQGQVEAAAGRKAPARKLFAKAAEWLEASIHLNEAGQRLTQCAYSLRDLGLVRLEQEDLARAEELLARAESLFRQLRLEEGLARTQSIQGMLARRRGQFPESERLLRLALAHFDRTRQEPRAAWVQLELARTLAEVQLVPQLVVAAYLDALRRAESCRQTRLVRLIEEELKALDEEAHWQHVYHRVRGRSVTADTSSLIDGESEVATALFLNLKGFMPFCQGLDAAEVMRTLNQMMADLVTVLDRHRASVVANLGGGFLALVRGPGHADRAVSAAVELLAVVEAFNRPRAVLGLRQLPGRIGIASGSVFLGNVGTYHKMDFTAVGVPVNLASRLVREADSRWPCISQETYELVHDRFEFAPGSPRTLELRGIGRRDVWDVVGRKKGSIQP
jgi:class 3 adenylate cyclase/predicted Ser/Thr protein kinase/Tfp pilus assembly protein PilF